MSSAAQRGAPTRVELPLHLKWSGPRVYDMSDPVQRRYVYEVVLREGGERDIRQFIDPDTLLEIWDQVNLPSHVRTAWTNWFRIKRGIDSSSARGEE